MIRLGLSDEDKRMVVARYVADHAIRHVVIIAPSRFRLDAIDVPSHEHVEWSEVILYKFYYRLLQSIDRNTLIVVNECLRTQDRNDLTYNCIRNYLQQTPHQIVFQYMPILDRVEDFAILLDFDTRSRWKREKLDRAHLSGLDLHIEERAPSFTAIHVAAGRKLRSVYAREKRRLIDSIGLRDPHTIPRTLHLMAGHMKASSVERGVAYVCRNKRFNLPDHVTYREFAEPRPRTVFEFCHNTIDMADFLAVTRQATVPALVSDLRVDAWYFDKYCAWSANVRAAYDLLRVA